MYDNTAIAFYLELLAGYSSILYLWCYHKLVLPTVIRRIWIFILFKLVLVYYQYYRTILRIFHVFWRFSVFEKFLYTSLWCKRSMGWITVLCLVKNVAQVISSLQLCVYSDITNHTSSLRVYPQIKGHQELQIMGLWSEEWPHGSHGISMAGDCWL